VRLASDPRLCLQTKKEKKKKKKKKKLIFLPVSFKASTLFQFNYQIIFFTLKRKITSKEKKSLHFFIKNRK